MKRDKKADIILQARSTSTRLPGKIFMDIRGRTMLEQILFRLSLVKNRRKLCVATIRGDAARIRRLAKPFGAEVVWGSENDVLASYRKAARKLGSTVIVRATADNPLVDYESLDRALGVFAGSGADYMVMEGLPYGAGFEIFTAKALDVCAKKARLPSEREHVTPFIYGHPGLFRIRRLKAPARKNRPGLRVTVDTAADLRGARKFYGMYFDDRTGTADLGKVISHERVRSVRP